MYTFINVNSKIFLKGLVKERSFECSRYVFVCIMHVKEV